MRRGQHTSRVLDAMRVPSPEQEPIIPITDAAGGDSSLELISGDPNHPL